MEETRRRGEPGGGNWEQSGGGNSSTSIRVHCETATCDKWVANGVNGASVAVRTDGQSVCKCGPGCGIRSLSHRWRGCDRSWSAKGFVAPPGRRDGKSSDCI